MSLFIPYYYISSCIIERYVVLFTHIREVIDMEEKFYSVDDISAMLGIHPKTTRRYITEGKLRAAKLGKQYRISGHDLSMFLEAHGAAAIQSPPAHKPQIDVSAVVDIDAADKDKAARISASILAATQSKDPSYGKSTVSVQQNSSRLRVMLWGTPQYITTMLACISDLNDNQ